ncbi:MAG: response regulator transcription factor [Bacteroidales bacterium]|nr:response regulator transcription factor [Bacteroidales bacterium]MBR6266626.1 response regulator transcription factor [Bacteroidales bacterium]
MTTNEQRTITCAIIEDEPLALHLMEEYVKRTPFLQLTQSYLDSELFLLDIQKGNAPDLLFSDIQMPQINGIELSKLLPENTKVVFTTAYSQYAIEGFKVNALDYLLKPISYDDFLVAAEKVLLWFKKEDKLQQADNLIKKHEQRPSLQIKIGRQTELIPFDEIVRIEGLKDYIRIFRKDGSKSISLMRMKNILKLLPENEFERIHKSHIINISAITACGPNYVIVNGKQLPVSNQYGKDIKEKWLLYLDTIKKYK